MGIEKTLLLKNFKIFPYIFPPLKENKLYLSVGLEKKKNEFTLEVTNYNLIFEQSNFLQENLIENRFWLYESNQTLDEKQYNYNFKLTDLSTKTFVFGCKKTKMSSLNSLIFFYSARKYALQNIKQNYVLKNRVLYLTRKGYNLSCFGKQAFLAKNFLFSTAKKPKKFLYSSWYVSNLSLVGILNSFKLEKWQVKNFNEKNKTAPSSFIKRFKFYYKKNFSLKSIIILEKRKLIYD